LTRPEEDPKEEQEAAEYKTTFLETMKELEGAGKYICHFDTKNNITTMCRKLENKLYGLRAQGKGSKRVTG
jgi:hypothetical protein